MYNTIRWKLNGFVLVYMRLKKLSECNKACIARLIWLLFSGSGSLWIARVHRHLLKGVSFWTIQLRSGISWTWRKVLKLCEVKRGFIKFQVGNGHKIFIWHDCWHPKGPLLLA